ncbi:MAG: hypothetical protein JXA20_02685 [Spirochaetes bacterium]|nr:hypothetical protein [Spirochaetota bacterium]
MEAEIRENLDKLLLPVAGKYGATQKVSSLIQELNHPNIDWKFAVAGIRSYLYDYIHSMAGHEKDILPILIQYLSEATSRKKGSALRASETFFDRYYYVARGDGDGTRFLALRHCFEERMVDYLALLMDLSREGYFFDFVNDMVMKAAGVLANGAGGEDRNLSAMNAFLALQYGLYIERSIVTTEDEMEEVFLHIIGSESAQKLVLLLKSVSSEAYREILEPATSGAIADQVELYRYIRDHFSFKHNAEVWERICFTIRQEIESGAIADDGSILFMLTFLIRKSNEGGDGELQLYMSRTVASVCSIVAANNNFDLLRNAIDLVMPVLLGEIERGGNYRSAFSTIFNIGKNVIESGNIFITDYFIDILVRSKFCFPEITGIASDWTVIVNSSHLENIRTWMNLIEINPSACRMLAASLIVNLKLGGVFLKDTDVFQRDISRLLNSRYRDEFYLITSLAAVFPAFYHDIGATGNIRAFTEAIDTNHKMNDLIHFLRKQVHVESSSQTVVLIQRIMEYWLTGDKQLLDRMVPLEVYENLDLFFRMINLDVEPEARIIYDAAREHFRDHGGEKFWDFLNAVGEEAFMAFLESHEFPQVAAEKRADMARYFREYFETRNPTEMTKILNYIKNRFGIDISETMIWKFLYEISDDDFREMFEEVGRGDISKINVEKFITLLHVYRMIFDKYNFSDVRAISKLELYAEENLFVPQEGFFRVLQEGSDIEALSALLQAQHRLKYEILLSEVQFEPVDTIEFKRHIAFGIPSMYGSYKEKKFDTLKVFFHINLLRVRFFERIVERLHLETYDPIDFDEIKTILFLFSETFLIDGLANLEMTTIINLLNTPNMKVSQFRDTVTHLLTIHGEISDRFNDTYKYVCREAIHCIGLDKISGRFMPKGSPPSIEVIIDRFMRDQIMQSPLLQLFDNLLISLKDYLSRDLAARGDAVCLNQVQKRRHGSYYFLIRKFKEPIPEGKTYGPIWEIGGKAHGLLFACNMEGLHVPAGFILSSDLYKRMQDGNINNPRFRRKMTYYLQKNIDELTKGRFANPKDPILFSVRSGAVFSMPGVMDTITNVGITQEIIDHYAEADEWFAYDIYRRLIQDFAISSYGMDRGIFENLMKEAKDQAGVALKEHLTGRQMEQLTRRYRYAINDYGFSIPKDPYKQLFYAILGVYLSWNSNISRNYREFINVSDEWGTAVIVQKMVFGNINPDFITGVVYSMYLGKEQMSLSGEYKTRAQGHDIVSGVAKVFPISEEQKKHHGKLKEFPSLELRFPSIYRRLFETVRKIRDRWGNDVEIEFTVENDVIYVLQIRGMTKHIFDIDEMVETPLELQESLIGQGLAASGGAVSGRVVFDINRIDLVREQYRGDKVILVRPETTPEDVIGLKKSDGILTCVGGMTSHAVLQMRRLEKSGVSDFSLMKIDERTNTAEVRTENPNRSLITIREGDFITIDGANGHVFIGYHKTRKKSIS